MSTFGVFPSGADGDDDNDDLTNADELFKYGTNPFAADTDGDGWIDGIEANDGTDPLNPASHPSATYLAAPPVQIELISDDTAGTSGNTLVIGQPPVSVKILP